ncbi:hypothetical protein [Streptomyces albidoflavus]|uniref:hypothetical protein n=1 Tax=Streptomyces albidoflavus TaxID=1886 RepID=UPI00331E1ED4
MIQKFKTKIWQRRDEAEAGNVPATANDASAQVSEDAACCVADIDEVLADVDEAMQEETEEEQAYRESDELWARYTNEEITADEYHRQRGILQARYAHLNLGSCWC